MFCKSYPVLIGDTIDKNITLKTIDNKVINLKEELSKKSMVVFYRGGWCPYCTSFLNELQDIENIIKSKGYEIYAISPDSFENANMLVQSDTLKYNVLSDYKLEAINSFGIQKKINPQKKIILSLAGINVKKRSEKEANKEHIIPISSLFIIVNGIIEFRYLTNYKGRRVPKKLILSILDFF